MELQITEQVRYGGIVSIGVDDETCAPYVAWYVSQKDDEGNTEIVTGVACDRAECLLGICTALDEVEGRDRL